MTTSDGARLAVTQRGRGAEYLLDVPGVLLGGMAYAAIEPSEERFYSVLAQHCRIVSFDFRGCGQSDRSRTDLDLDAYVRDIEAVVQHLGSRTHILGVFHGAPAAIAFASRHPDSVNRMLLWTPYLDGARWATSSKLVLARGMLETNYSVWTEAITRWSGLDGAHAMDALASCFQQNLPAQTMSALIAGLDTVSVEAEATRVAAPTLLMHPRQSGIVPKALVEEVAAAIPGAQLRMLEGHHAFPQFDRSGDVARQVLDWLGLETRLSESPAPIRLEVGEAGLWFRVAGKPLVDLRRRRTLSALLEALTPASMGDPGRALTVEQLFAAGWPDARILAASGAHRVYVAVAELRKLGLRDILLRQGNGYLLDPSVPSSRSAKRPGTE